MAPALGALTHYLARSVLLEGQGFATGSATMRDGLDRFRFDFLGFFLFRSHVHRDPAGVTGSHHASIGLDGHHQIGTALRTDLRHRN